MPQHVDLQAIGHTTAESVSLIHIEDDRYAVFIDGKETDLVVRTSMTASVRPGGARGESLLVLFIETQDMLVRTEEREVRSY